MPLNCTATAQRTGLQIWNSTKSKDYGKEEVNKTFASLKDLLAIRRDIDRSRTIMDVVRKRTNRKANF